MLSGGNVDATRLTECIRMGETAAGRRLVFSTVVSDQPGELARLLEEVAAAGANVLDVVHIREGVDLHVRETGIRLVLQTDGPEHGERVLAAVRAQGFAARGRAAGELARRCRPRAGWCVRDGAAGTRGGGRPPPALRRLVVAEGQARAAARSGSEAALREVEEETGLRCELGEELEPARYRDRKGRDKLVRWWRMRPLGGEFVAGDEVDELRWVELGEALERCSTTSMTASSSGRCRRTG